MLFEVLGAEVLVGVPRKYTAVVTDSGVRWFGRVGRVWCIPVITVSRMES